MAGGVGFGALGLSPVYGKALAQKRFLGIRLDAYRLGSFAVSEWRAGVIYGDSGLSGLERFSPCPAPALETATTACACAVVRPRRGGGARRGRGNHRGRDLADGQQRNGWPLNPNGIASFSPGLSRKAGSYPGTGRD